MRIRNRFLIGIVAGSIIGCAFSIAAGTARDAAFLSWYSMYFIQLPSLSREADVLQQRELLEQRKELLAKAGDFSSQKSVLEHGPYGALWGMAVAAWLMLSRDLIGKHLNSRFDREDLNESERIFRLAKFQLVCLVLLGSICVVVLAVSQFPF